MDLRADIRKAELLGTMGAGVLGAGLALLLQEWLAGVAVPLLLFGLIAHAYGMFARRRLESNAAVIRAKWETPMYWLCWAALTGVFVYAFVAA